MNVFLRHYYCQILCYVAFELLLPFSVDVPSVFLGFGGFGVMTQVKSTKQMSLYSKRRTNLGFDCSFDFSTFSASCVDNNEWLPIGVIVQFWGN